MKMLKEQWRELRMWLEGIEGEERNNAKVEMQNAEVKNNDKSEVSMKKAGKKAEARIKN